MKRAANKVGTVLRPLSFAVFLLCVSCATTGSVIQSADVKKLRSGMIEKEVIAVLHANPDSGRYYFTDGTYLVHWNNPHELGHSGDIKSLAILFKQDSGMIMIVDQENFVAEDY